MEDDDGKVNEKGSGLSRRNFLKVSGISLSVPLVIGYRVIKLSGSEVACNASLYKNPTPTAEQIQKGLGGNTCRCGTYMGVRAAVAQAAQTGQKGGKRNG